MRLSKSGGDRFYILPGMGPAARFCQLCSNVRNWFVELFCLLLFRYRITACVIVVVGVVLLVSAETWPTGLIRFSIADGLALLVFTVGHLNRDLDDEDSDSVPY